MDKKNSLKKEFEKSEHLTTEIFQSIKDWCSTQPQLPVIPDELLALFLQSCYFKLDDTKTCIEHYFSIRSQVPEIFSDRDPYSNDLVNGKPVVEFSILNNTTPDGYRILFVKFGITNSDKFNLQEVCKSFTMHSDLDLYLNGSCPGWIILFDMKGLGLGHVKKLSLSLLKKILTYLQDAMPVRLKGWHIINVSSVLNIIFGMIKPFLKKELVDMMHFHTKIETLFEFIPKNVLPSEYGGEDKSTDELMRNELKLLQSHKQYFEEESKLRIVETKKKEKS